MERLEKMKLKAFFLLLVITAMGTQAGAGEPPPDAIRPYPANPRYWQYQGQPVLLLGATDNDNLFQSPDVREQLDTLAKIGGNYIRNTMSSRDDGDLWPFHQLPDGRYDLNKWNAAYWDKFEGLLKMCAGRDIIVQIEVWDRFDFSRDPWQANPFNPKNNINYSTEECGMAPRYPRHPGQDIQPFFHSFEGMPLYTPQLERVKKYQQRYVDRMLRYSLQYENVLYCMNNETSTPPQWGRYWMNYIQRAAAEHEKQVYTTDMFDHFYKPIECRRCQEAIENPEVYAFLDISQINSRNFGRKHWDVLQWIVNQREKFTLRPLNCTKVYGGGNTGWGSGSNQDGVERFCRDIIGGCASARHHRPPAGNGLNEKARAAILSVRKVETLVRFWDVEPMMSLLAENQENEAYLTAKPGEKYVIYFPAAGSVTLDLRPYPNRTFQGRWIQVSNGQWGERLAIRGGDRREITTPGNTGWFAVLVNQDMDNRSR